MKLKSDFLFFFGGGSEFSSTRTTTVDAGDNLFNAALSKSKDLALSASSEHHLSLKRGSSMSHFLHNKAYASVVIV